MPEDEKYFRPRNWEKYQSRSNNSLSWVKIATGLLRDPDYSMLTDAQKLTWIELILLSGVTGRPLPLNSRWIGAQLSRDSRAIGRALPQLLSNKFIELCDRTEKLHSDPPPPRGEERRRDKKDSLMSTPSLPLNGVDVSEQLVSIYNSSAGAAGAVSCQKIAPATQKAMMLRFKGDFAAEVDQWRAFCWRVAESKFLTGKAPASGDRKKPFRASIDWIVKPANLAKIINGNYDDGGGGDGPGGPRDINEVMG